MRSVRTGIAGALCTALAALLLVETACGSALEPGPPQVAGTWLFTAEWEDVAAQDLIAWSATLSVQQNGDSISGNYNDILATHCTASPEGGAASCNTNTYDNCWWCDFGGNVNSDGTVWITLYDIRASGTVNGDSMMGKVWIGSNTGSWRAFRQ